MILYTARVDYGGADRLDVTRKSGKGVGLLLAPSWSILLPVISARRAGKETQESWEAYEQAYLAELRASYRANRPQWLELLAWEEVTLCCYCDLAFVGTRCHRLILADVLQKLGAQYRGERGENS